jgi:nucleotide-binding universal stress UspA family protein
MEKSFNMYDHILVALDGSEPSQYAGQIAIDLAQVLECRITACHVYGAEFHRRRFTDMEPGLPSQYQDDRSLTYLRSTHDKLIHEGFHSLSTGYMEDFIAACRDKDIKVESASAEGRSYVGILQLAAQLKCDLIALGADGLGATGNGLLGGTTTRILNSAPCDVLIARAPLNAGPILTGVDGSQAALNAVDTAVNLGRVMQRPVHMAAVYDPDFHTHVFGVMAQALSAETQEQIGLEGQEQLHDEIINDGLGKLYTEFLNQAREHISENSVKLTQSLLTGKPYCVLNKAAQEQKSALVVLSRHGHHRESCSRLGSNAEGLIRTTSANVLLVGGIDEKQPETRAAVRVEQLDQPGNEPAWDPASQQRLKRVPSFVRTMAKNMVENAVKKAGRTTVTAADFDTVAEQFGMMPKKDNQ